MAESAQLSSNRMSLNSQRWLILAVLLLARTSMGYQFETVGAIGPILIDVFRIDFTWLGTLIGLYMLPGAFVAIPSGLIGQRFGAKRIVLAGLLLMALGGVLTSTESLQLAFAGRLISGIGGVIMNVMMTKMVADWFAGQEIVVAMSIFVASWPLGIALGLVTFPSIAALSSWHVVMITAAVVALLSFAMMIALYRDPPNMPPLQEGKLQIGLSGREWRLALSAGMIWGTYNVAYIVLVSFVPELFTVRGYSLGEAGRAVSLLGWALIFVVPLAGYLAQRVQRPNLLMATGFIVVGLTSLALPFTSAFIATFMFIAVVAGLPAGLIMALPSEALSQQNRAVGMGVFFTCFYACMAILPAFAGKMRDLTGSPAAPSLFAASMMGVALLGLILFRLAQRRPQ